MRSISIRSLPLLALVLVSAIPLLIVACGQTQDDASNEPSPSEAAATTAEGAAAEASRAEVEQQETIDAASEDLRARRERLENEAERILERLNVEIEETRSTLREVPTEASEQYRRAAARGEHARQAVTAEIEAMKEATAETWSEARSRLEAALTEAREAQRDIGRALAGEDS